MSVRFDLGFELALDTTTVGVKFSANADGSHELEIYREGDDLYVSTEISKEDAAILLKYLEVNDEAH